MIPNQVLFMGGSRNVPLSENRSQVNPNLEDFLMGS